MGTIIDADTHVSESESMWSLLEKEAYPKRPILMRVPNDTLYKERDAFLAHRWSDSSKTGGPSGKRAHYTCCSLQSIQQN